MDESELGLRRVVVRTPSGPVVVRVGPPADGPATVLLHGAAGSWTTWTPLIRAAARRGRPSPNLVIPDLPGWGESAALEDPMPMVGDLSDIVAAAAESLGHPSWTVIGHSLGGFVALDLAVRRPVATLAVALVSPTGKGVVDAIRRPFRGGARLPGFAGMLLVMRAAAALGPVADGILRLLNRTGLLRPLSFPLFADGRSLDASVFAALAREIRPSAFVAAARAAGRYDLEQWRRIAAPVVSVRGERDVFSAVGDAEEFARRIPHFAEHRLPGAGHFAAIERPDAVLDLLERARGQAPAGNGAGA